MADVDIVLPDGGAATVPEGDLSQALAAGASLPKQSSDDAFLNSGLGQGITGVLGAGRAVSGGLTDLALSEAGNLIGGEGLRRDTLDAFRRAKETNATADMIGETAGLLLPGGGSLLTQAGEGAERGIASLVGEGLGGRIASGAGRGAVEGAIMGAQHQITEDTLGDHALNGQKLFESMGENALLGGAIGGSFGAAGYGLGRLLGTGEAAATKVANAELAGVTGLAEKGAGPYRTMGTAVEDELAGGVKGSGRAVAEQMGHAESAISELEKTGLTSEQATSMMDKVMETAQRGNASKETAGFVDQLADMYSTATTSGNAERKAVLQRAYGQQAKLITATEDVLDRNAVELTNAGTKALRLGADIADEVSFTQRPDIFEKLTAGVDRRVARDALTSTLQDVSETLMRLDEMPTKGGIGPSAFKKLAAIQEEAAAVLRNADSSPGEMMMAATKMKQGIGRNTNFEAADHLKSVADRELGGTKLDPTGGLYQRIRKNLEDTSVWGKAAEANQQINSAFAEAHPRTQHFLGELGVSIDRTDMGRRLTDIDYTKTKGMLGKLTGAETDDMLQGVISTNRWIDGLQRRIEVAREYGTASPAQLKQMEEGIVALREFKDKFASARGEVSAANQVKAQKLLERETPGLGGMLGLVTDMATKPLTTMERLADVRRGIDRAGGTIDKALKSALDQGTYETVGRATARTKEAIAGSVEKIREIAASPEKMAAHLESVGKQLAGVAPKITAEVRATTQRAIMYLAQHAPVPSVPIGLMAIHAATKKPIYSDQQLHDWEKKKNAIMGAASGQGGVEHVLSGVKSGTIDRDAIEAIKFTSPQLFAQVQATTLEQLQKMAADGTIDKLSYQRRAAIATLIEVPPDETWTPTFMSMMQASKQQPAAGGKPSSVPQPNSGVSKRAVKMDNTTWQSPSAAIAGRKF